MTQPAGTIDQAAALIARARYVVALAGAGLSAGSGIPTYRGAGGLWTQHGAPAPAVLPGIRQRPGGLVAKAAGRRG